MRILQWSLFFLIPFVFGFGPSRPYGPDYIPEEKWGHLSISEKEAEAILAKRPRPSLPQSPAEFFERSSDNLYLARERFRRTTRLLDPLDAGDWERIKKIRRALECEHNLDGGSI